MRQQVTLNADARQRRGRHDIHRVGARSFKNGLSLRLI
jgi:hypothetical protein